MICLDAERAVFSEGRGMTYQEVLENARKRMAPRCRVCPECNGIACRGVMPGPAGKGASRTFQRNAAWLTEHIKLEKEKIRMV